MRPTIKLWEICDVISWQSPESKYYNESGEWLPFFQWKTEFTEKYIWTPKTWTKYTTKESIKNDILMSVRAPVWPVNINWFDKICIWRWLCAIRPSNKVELDYLFNFLLSIQEQLTWNRGSVFASINRSQIENIEIPLPPLETQKAIVAKLDQIFAELDQTKSEIQKNLDNTDELWKSTLNQAFQGDWEMKKLGEVCKFVRWPFWWSLKKEIFVKKWFAVYEQQHAIYNQFSDFRYFINDEKFLEMKRFEVYPWDLIMSCSWTMGKVSIVPENSPKWIINQALLKITPSKSINAEFLKNWMDSKDFQDQIWMNTQWAAIQNVASVKVISTLNIPVPPLSEQEKIVEHLDQVSKEVKALKSQYQSQLDNLEELKKSVLDKAFRWEMGE